MRATEGNSPGVGNSGSLKMPGGIHNSPGGNQFSRKSVMGSGGIGGGGSIGRNSVYGN